MHKSIYLLLMSTSLLAVPAIADTEIGASIGNTTGVRFGHRTESRNGIVISTTIGNFKDLTPRYPSQREQWLLEREPRVHVYYRQPIREYRVPPRVIYVPERRTERVVYLDHPDAEPGWRYSTERYCQCDDSDVRRSVRVQSFYRYDSWDE
ncbi:hypothetical protein [Chitinimonas sp. BJB300]|uniref:hypothetical protein n=1 Tax=Chitinimonas sp. BJB300 TaxID=1559339 RepID=UPI000C0E743C|nr:hypothetical protein [Chitinimonas sp. BJB300]PHV10130.1 hypothetical protein CSQ89_17885 [Chitinimonas sp. BJB300]TSJ90963.1 hypothetical protein FG002_001240 [Chitinimonas sp. BJB300]